MDIIVKLSNDICTLLVLGKEIVILKKYVETLRSILKVVFGFLYFLYKFNCERTLQNLFSIRDWFSNVSLNTLETLKNK